MTVSFVSNKYVPLDIPFPHKLKAASSLHCPVKPLSIYLIALRGHDNGPILF